MRKSKAHEYRQAYNAQAVVCAEGSQLILSTNMATTPSDQRTCAATILAMAKTVGLPRTVLADAGFACGPAVAELEATASNRWSLSPAPSHTAPTTSDRRPNRSPSAGSPSPGASR